MMHPSRQVYVGDGPQVRDTRIPRRGTVFTPAAPVSSAPCAQLRAGRLMAPSLAQELNGGISLADVPVDRNYELNTAGGVAPEKASAILEQFDRKRRLATLAVPTDDGKVRARLRELEEPITLFGEGPADRRDRLRELLLDQQEDGDDGTPDVQMQDADEAGDQEEEFYTEGPPELLAARQDIARYSLPRAQARIRRLEEDSSIPLRTHIKHRKEIKEKLAGFDLFGTQIAGERPVSIARFSPNGEIIAAGNWAGGIKLLDVPNLDERVTLRGHTGIVGGISWFPGATLPDSTVSPNLVNLASGGGGMGGSNDVHLWSLNQDTPLATLAGHTGRVCRVEFHPSGKYLASASYDTTWRLWDVETSTELVLQEGHSKEVYTVSFDTHGALLASGGLDSIGRIWDLRTGRTVMILEGHIREIFALDWSVDGHRVLSGAGDGWLKCWDLRRVKTVGGIGAHTGNVSDLRWFKGIDSDVSSLVDSDSVKQEYSPRKAGTFVVTSGFDKKVNIYSADDWSFVKQLSGHSGNVLSVDVSHDAKWIVSSGHDRTVKLWGRDDGLGI
jgi:U4/U6 small nuclear ribonucleoprotein PRP4